MKMNQVNTKIKTRREQLNYSQEYVADRIGISQPAYVKIEKGNTKLDFERLLKIAAILELDINELLNNNNVIDPLENKKTYSNKALIENLFEENQKSKELLLERLLQQISDLKDNNEKLFSIIEKLSVNK